MSYDPIFKKLPFYRILTPAIDTTLLSQVQRQSKYITREFFFSVPNEFKGSISASSRSSTKTTTPSSLFPTKIEVQLRFCRRLSGLKSSNEVDDYIPPELEVYLNRSIPDLPPFTDFEQKNRKPRPIDLTNGCITAKQNQITMSWFSSQSDNYEYFFTIHLVERISYEDIVGAMSTSLEDDTRILVIKSLGGGENDTNFLAKSDLAVTSLTVSLLCPLGMRRMKVPCRSMYCTHVQCFDIFNYLQINEFKPTWKCPVCRDKAPFDTLVIDGLFKTILKDKSLKSEVDFSADGSWVSPPSPNDESVKDSDSDSADDDGCPRKSDNNNKTILNRPKSAGARSSPRIQKRLSAANSPRNLTNSPNPSGPKSIRRRKQKFPISSPYISDVIEIIKNQTKSGDVVDLTID